MAEGRPVYPAYNGIVLYTEYDMPYGCGKGVFVKSKIGNKEVIILYGNIVPSQQVDPNDPNQPQRYIKKNQVIGKVASCADEYGGPHLSVAIMSNDMENVRSPCGNRIDCGSYDNLENSIEHVAKSGGAIPWWCGVFKWDSGKLYHERFTAVEGKHWRYDEDNNVFIKKNIALKFRMEDWFPVLDCSRVSNKPDENRFNWLSEKDMICFNGKLYTCNRDVAGIDYVEQKIDLRGAIGNYMCVQAFGQNRFCYRGDDGDNVEQDGELVETNEDIVCCAGVTGSSSNARTSTSGRMIYCKNDNYCSEAEQGRNMCENSCDCCMNHPDCETEKNDGNCVNACGI